MATPVAMSSTPPAWTNKKSSFVEHLDDVRRLREHEHDSRHDIGISPTTKDMILAQIQQEKKKVMTDAAATD